MDCESFNANNNFESSHYSLILFADCLVIDFKQIKKLKIKKIFKYSLYYSIKCNNSFNK